MSHRILVTGSGGIGGVNFITALKSTSEQYLITGTDFNKYYLEFALPENFGLRFSTKDAVPSL